MKKGQVFLSSLVLISLVMFSYMAFVIITHEDKRDQQFPNAIGYSSLSLIKVYDEAEQASFFLEDSVMGAAEDAKISLDENGGFAGENDCQKTSDGFVIWSSCSVFDPESQFEKQFEKDLKEYLVLYDSNYLVFKETDALRNLRKELALLPQEVGDAYVNSYTDIVRNATISKIEKKDDAFIVSFDPLVFPIEYATRESSYKESPIVSFEKPDLSTYDDLYLALDSCIAGEPEVQECMSFLSNQFPDIALRASETLLFVSYNDIRFATDISQPLPSRQVFRVA